MQVCCTCHAILEFGTSNDAIELRIKSHMIQVGRYGLLYVLYYARITNSEDVRYLIRLGLKSTTRREVDTAFRQGGKSLGQIDIVRHYVV